MQHFGPNSRRTQGTTPMENSRLASQEQHQAPRCPLQARRGPFAEVAEPFNIECSLVRVFVAAEIGDDPGHLHWGGQREVVVIFGTDQIGQLPEPLAELVLPLLQTPDVVKFSVRPASRMPSIGRLGSETTTTTTAAAGAPAGTATATAAPAAPAAVTYPGVVSTVDISVQPLERSLLEPHAEVVRQLAEWPSAWRPRKRSRPSVSNVDAASPPARADSVRARTTPPVYEETPIPATSPPERADSVRARTMPPVSEVNSLTVIMERLSSQDIFGQARRVNKMWRVAADRVAPLTSYRRQVAETMIRKPGGRPTYASPPPVAGAAAATAERVLLPSVEWFRDENFHQCGGEHVMTRLEGAVRWLDRQAQEEEVEQDDNGANDGCEHVDGCEEKALRAQHRRLEPQLSGVRQLCVEKGLLPAATRRAASGETAPAETSATRAFGVRASFAEAAATSAAAASAAATSVAAQESRDRGRTSGEHRWDGWTVFALVVVLAFSEDRQFLCRWAMQALGETGRLPRLQIIELLCKMHQALRPPDRVGTRRTSFQTASNISSEWDRAGTYQLWADLRACIKAMEACSLRLPQPAPNLCDQDCRLSQTSASQDRIDLSTLTPEQLAVVNTELEAGEVLKVEAFAGTGKTRCLRAWAQQNPQYDILHLSFNTSVCEEAMELFPENVTCKTIHKICEAGNNTSYRRNGKLGCTVEGLQGAITTEGCGNGPAEEQHANAKDVMATLGAFWCSAGECVQAQHFRSKQRSATPGGITAHKTWVLRTAGVAWEWMQNPDGGLPMTFAGVVKLFQLKQKTNPDLGDVFDVIMLDEAQDINDCMADIVLGQKKARIILVGDRHQTIYGWIGARNQLDKAQATKTLSLTQGFRFGVAIASVANAVISNLKGEKRPLLGSLALFNSRPAQVLFARERFEWLRLDPQSRGDYTFIARTNAGLIEEALAAIARGERVKFQDGTASVGFDDVKDLCKMMLGQRLGAGANRELRTCGTIDRLRRKLEESEDAGLGRIGPKLRLVDTLMQGGKTPHDIMEDIDNLSNMANSGMIEGPRINLSTVHKAKGLEFDTVMLGSDFTFRTMAEGRQIRGPQDEENAHLLYVAITRAKRLVLLNNELSRQLSSLHMWDSLSVRGLASDAALGLPVLCWNCENTVQAGAENVAGDPDGRPRREQLVYAGSMSKKTVCQACVEGDGGEGRRVSFFPYASELLRRGV